MGQAPPRHGMGVRGQWGVFFGIHAGQVASSIATYPRLSALYQASDGKSKHTHSEAQRGSCIHNRADLW